MEESEKNSFQLALRAAASIGPVPTSFSGVVRLLCADYRDGYDGFSKKSEFEINRIMKVSTVVALLYFAAETYLPEKVEERDLRPMDLARLFDPLSLAAIFSLTYLYKRCHKLCPPEEWKRLGPSVNKWVEIGGLLGKNVPGIGLGVGILGGAIPLLGNTPFILHDYKGFVEHRRAQGGYRLLGSPAKEVERFGCAALGLGGAMLQMMGFGPEFSAAFEGGLATGPMTNPGDLHKAFRLFATWGRGLESEVRQPSEVAGANQTVEVSQLPKLLGRVSDIFSQMVETKWLDRTKDDLTPEAAPLLRM